MKIAKNPDIPGVIEIAGSSAGPRAVIFAGVHGDEVSGIHAIDKLLFDFFGGERTLTRGHLTLARGNAQAIAEERRYVRYNLNRMYKDEYDNDIDRSSYESQR